MTQFNVGDRVDGDEWERVEVLRRRVDELAAQCQSLRARVSELSRGLPGQFWIEGSPNDGDEWSSAYFEGESFATLQEANDRVTSLVCDGWRECCLRIVQDGVVVWP